MASQSQVLGFFCSLRFQGRTWAGTQGARPPPLRRANLILYLLAFLFLRQSTFYLSLHCTHPNSNVTKRNKLYSDSQQYPSKLCLIKYLIKYPWRPFWKLIIFICGTCIFHLSIITSYCKKNTLKSHFCP